MIHLFSLSKAMAIPIQSYCCPLENAPSSSLHPYSMFVNKSCYKQTFKSLFVTVMWTITSASESEPNQFVLLVPYHSLTRFRLSCSHSWILCHSQHLTCRPSGSNRECRGAHSRNQRSGNSRKHRCRPRITQRRQATS